MTPLTDNLIQLEISSRKLATLLQKGELCAADMRCLNGASKDCLWRLCLTCCGDKQYKCSS